MSIKHIIIAIALMTFACDEPPPRVNPKVEICKAHAADEFFVECKCIYNKYDNYCEAVFADKQKIWYRKLKCSEEFKVCIEYKKE